MKNVQLLFTISHLTLTHPLGLSVVPDPLIVFRAPLSLLPPRGRALEISLSTAPFSSSAAHKALHTQTCTALCGSLLLASITRTRILCHGDVRRCVARSWPRSPAVVVEVDVDACSRRGSWRFHLRFLCHSVWSDYCSLSWLET